MKKITKNMTIGEVLENNKNAKTITFIFVTLISVVVYVLASVETHIGFLSIIYSTVAIILIALLLYRSINSAIRHENYEQ